VIEMVERVARYLHERDVQNGSGLSQSWESEPEETRDWFRYNARGVLAIINSEPSIRDQEDLAFMESKSSDVEKLFVPTLPFFEGLP